MPLLERRKRTKIEFAALPVATQRILPDESVPRSEYYKELMKSSDDCYASVPLALVAVEREFRLMLGMPEADTAVHDDVSAKIREAG